MNWRQLPGAPAPGTVLARLEAVPDGGALLANLGAEAAPFKIILLRSGRAVFAYVNRCAHFGVPLAEKTEHLGIRPHESIRCCVHYARYRWRDGSCESGECEGAGLLPISLVVRDGLIAIAADDA
ncbi:MAG: Rieske 2Fe-2S domain-containing protein [Pseudomonadota bacterium]|jgi:nitrite reductase/ring-hydroxylating ferredoxin subunit